MENKLQIFEHERFGKVRVVMKNDKPWFVAADVCRVLELADTHVALRKLDDDEKGRYLIPTLGGEQEMLIVNEPGLYRLIFASRKPEAKEFQRWVFHEVLVSLRETGTYTVDNPRIPTDQLIKSLAEIVWHGERVLTTTQLSAVYEVSKSAIRMTLHRNRDKFAEGVHFFKLKGDELRKLGTIEEITGQHSPHSIPSLYLWTKQGAALFANRLFKAHVKKAFALLEIGYFGKSVTADHTQKFSPQEKFNALLKCAELTDNAELRDSIIRQTVKLILS